MDSTEEFRKIQRDISFDLNRTFTDDILKTKENKNKLYNILLCVAMLKPEIGYCQGMNFIAASILVFHNWELTVSIEFMYYLIENNEMTYMFVKVRIIIK